MKSERDYGIDLIRGFSVLYIVSYWHLFNYTEAFRAYYNPFTHNLTNIILASFVFVSGYLIAGKNLEITWGNVLSFWYKRLIRIYPLYALALLLFYFNNIASKEVLIKGALLVSMFMPPAPPTLWFITMIMLFYLIAPLLIRYVNNLPIYLVINIILMVIFSFAEESKVFIFYPSFALGLWLKANPNWLKKVQEQQFIITVVFTLLYYFHFTEIYRSAPRDFLTINIIFINMGAILFYFYSGQIMRKIKFSQPVQTISYASFCMYLFHRPIFSLTRYTFFPVSETAQVIYLLVVAVPLIIVISLLIQTIYDRFCLPWLNPQVKANKELIKQK